MNTLKKLLVAGIPGYIEAEDEVIYVGPIEQNRNRRGVVNYICPKTPISPNSMAEVVFFDAPSDKYSLPVAHLRGYVGDTPMLIYTWYVRLFKDIFRYRIRIYKIPDWRD